MEFEELGIREECGVFGCIASGLWPTELDVPHVITLGLVGLQHSFSLLASFSNKAVCHTIW
uniref:Glutamine amidotransferase type-2 domain-containing protein n=1 Tax=Podarcis muralis TaxID=64176 RepID=A0A670I8T7_PODMU